MIFVEMRKLFPEVIPCRNRPSRFHAGAALEPEKRICPLFDPTTIPLVLPEESALVQDNFCEEHIQ